MKKTYAFFTLLAALAFQASAQQVMTIHHTDGTSTTYRVSDVKEVTFEQRELNKQYEINGEIFGIESVVESVSPFDESTSTFYVSNAEIDTTDPASVQAPIAITISNSQLNKSLDLATATADQVTIACDGLTDLSSLEGTLKVSKDKLGSTLTIALDAKSGKQTLAAAYRGSFTKSYVCSNTYDFTPYHQDEVSGTVYKLFRFDSADGTYSSFAFGSLETSTAQGLTSGNYAVILQFPSSVVSSGATIDLATQTDLYKLTFVDYTTQIAYEADAYTTGSITFVPLSGNKVAVKFNATFVNGITISAEYCGSTVEAETLDNLVPKAQVTNGIRIYESDGKTVSLEQNIGSVQVREKTSKGEAWLWFYFIPEGESSPNDQTLVPLLKVKKSVIGTGDVDLTSDEANVWSIKYKDMQLQSKDNEYVNHPNTSGTLSIDADGNDYIISFSVTNYYDNPWQAGSTSGDGRIIMIQYSGEGSDYTGY